MLSAEHDKTDTVEDLIQGYLNEKYSPELLIYNPIIDKYNELIKKQQDLLLNIEDYFTSYCLQLELERIKYVLRLYLRERIMKIEQLKCESYKLSQVETFYLQRFKEILPIEINQEPNMQKGVFCKVLEDVGQIYTDSNETIKMEKDDVFLIQYATIRKLLNEGSVILI